MTLLIFYIITIYVIALILGVAVGVLVADYQTNNYREKILKECEQSMDKILTLKAENEKKEQELKRQQEQITQRQTELWRREKALQAERVKLENDKEELPVATMAFGYDFKAPSTVYCPDESLIDGKNIWFIGDCHGEFDTVQSALSFISTQDTDAVIVFLGDIFDRFADGDKVAKLILQKMSETPDKIFWIAGNHDDGLYWDESRNCFASNVRPQEFCHWLTKHIAEQGIKDLGLQLIKIIKRLPAVLLLPDGLCVVHGGVPSPDGVFDDDPLVQVRSMDDLGKFRHDFIYNRIVDAKDKCGGECGMVQVVNFYNKLQTLGKKANRLLRGHDHGGAKRYYWNSFPSVPSAENKDIAPILTMTTISHWNVENGETPRGGNLSYTIPAIAKYRPGNLPKVYCYYPNTQTWQAEEEQQNGN